MRIIEILTEGKGLWANIHAKQERIKHGSGERMRKPGSKGAPTAKNFKDASKTDEAVNPAQQAAIAISKKKEQGVSETIDNSFNRMMNQVTSKDAMNTREALGLMLDLIYNQGASHDEALHQASVSYEIDPAKIEALYQQQNKEGIAESLTLDEQFDIIEDFVESLAESQGVDSDRIWEYFEKVDDNRLFETAVWQKKAGKNKNGGLNKRGVAAYRREHPGSKLQTAVTTKPSKLKPGSKAAKRRKSFCARMGGMKGPMKDKNGKPTRKALSLRKWNC